jgi:hypothetical protein
MSKLRTNRAKIKQAGSRLEGLYIHGQADDSATVPELALALITNIISTETSASP